MPFVPDVSRTPGRSMCFLPLLVAVFVSQSVFASNDNVAQTPERSIVDEQPSVCGRSMAANPVAIISPGVQSAETSYDRQHPGSQGHQVARNLGAEDVHFAFTYWGVVPTGIEAGDRFVNYTSWNRVAGTTNQLFPGASISLGNFARAGFVRGDVASGNQFHATLHQDSALYASPTIWHYRFVTPPLALVQIWNLGPGLSPRKWDSGRIALSNRTLLSMGQPMSGTISAPVMTTSEPDSTYRPHGFSTGAGIKWWVFGTDLT